MAATVGRLSGSGIIDDEELSLMVGGTLKRGLFLLLNTSLAFDRALESRFLPVGHFRW